jgi:hypothetical protein
MISTKASHSFFPKRSCNLKTDERLKKAIKPNYFLTAPPVGGMPGTLQQATGGTLSGSWAATRLHQSVM